MKTTKLSLSFILLLSTLVFTNCTKDQQVNYSDTTNEIITQGKWTVEYFFADQDLTSNYSNYQFSFLGNGTLTATSNGQSVNGTWKTIRDENRNEVLQILINTGDPSLIEINEHWNVTTKTFVKLTMVEGNNHLRLQKI
jgi:hypothetical protein